MPGDDIDEIVALFPDGPIHLSRRGGEWCDHEGRVVSFKDWRPYDADPIIKAAQRP